MVTIQIIFNIMAKRRILTLAVQIQGQQVCKCGFSEQRLAGTHFNGLLPRAIPLAEQVGTDS